MLKDKISKVRRKAPFFHYLAEGGAHGTGCIAMEYSEQTLKLRQVTCTTQYPSCFRSPELKGVDTSHYPSLSAYGPL
eukprot:1156815-Pelagomonas_calceolata.AAC.2